MICLIANFVSDPNSQFYRSAAFCINNELCEQKAKTDEHETEDVKAKPYSQ